MRSDAQRNRDLLLAAAATAIDEKGIEVPLEEIARRAGVGIGTLYRHFPTRDTLIEAVYRREVELLCDGVDELMADNPPDVALAIWMRRFAAYVARKRGMATALKALIGTDSELFAYTHKRIHDALDLLVESAATAGTIRQDVASEDLLRGLSGVCMAADSPGWQDRTGRLVDLLVDGLRFGARTPAVAASS